MSFLPPAVFTITANATQALASMQSVNTQLKAMELQAAKTGTSLSVMTRSAVIAGAAFKALGVITAGFAVYGIKEVTGLEKSLTQLGTAMNNVGVASEANLKSVRDLIDSYEQLGFDAQNGAAAYKVLITATGDVAKSNELLKTSADLARTSGMSLEGAALTLARATQGSARAFKEFGITLDTSIPQAQAVDKAMQELTARIGGQATAYTKTFRGQLEVLGVKMQGFAEGIGLLVLPKLIAFIDALGRLAGWLKENQEVMIATAAVMTGIMIVAIVNMTKRLYEMALAWAAANWQLTLIVAVVALVAAGFTYLWNNFENFRKGVVRGLQAILNVFAFFLRSIGLVGEAFLQVTTGPVRLLLKALGFFNPEAKKLAEQLDTIPKAFGDWFDSAADKVNAFSNSIAGLANKKINIKIGLPSLDIPTTGAAGTFTPSGDPETIKNLSKLQDLYKKRAQIVADGEEKITKIRQDYADKVADIQKDYAKNVAQAQNDAAKRAADIVKQSIDQLRNAFRSAVYRGVGDLYDALTFQGRYLKGGNITALVTGLSKQLNKAKTLSEDAAKLAGLGFSQSFIEEVVAKGPDVGHSLAETIINSTPEQVAELQKTWTELNNTSSHGVDNVAKTLNSGMKLATEELTQALAQVQIDLNDTMVSLSSDLAENLAEASKSFQESMAEAQKAISDSLDAVNADIRETIGLLGNLATARANAGVAGAGGAPSGSGGGGGGGGSTSSGAQSQTAQGVKNKLAGMTINQYNSTNASPQSIAVATAWAIRTSSDGVYITDPKTGKSTKFYGG